MADTVYDVVIVGGGPAGLSCAIYAARGRLSTIVLDRAPTAGSLAYAEKIANYPGVHGDIPGADLLSVMRDQAVDFGAVYRKTTVSATDVLSEPKAAYTPDAVYHGRAIVIATGSRGRVEKVEGEERYLGRGVSYCAMCDGAFYAEKAAAVVGYDEVALEETMFLARFARDVHLICPKSALEGPVDLMAEVAAASNVTTHLGKKALRIVGDDFVRGVEVRVRDGGREVIPLDGVFMLLAGNAPITDLLGGALELDAQGCVDVDCNYQTALPGVYAVGDVTCLHPNQAIIAAAAGVIAALSIDKYLSGRDRARVDYL